MGLPGCKTRQFAPGWSTGLPLSQRGARPRGPTAQERDLPSCQATQRCSHLVITPKIRVLAFRLLQARTPHDVGFNAAADGSRRPEAPTFVEALCDKHSAGPRPCHLTVSDHTRVCLVLSTSLRQPARLASVSQPARRLHRGGKDRHCRSRAASRQTRTLLPPRDRWIQSGCRKSMIE